MTNKIDPAGNIVTADWITISAFTSLSKLTEKTNRLKGELPDKNIHSLAAWEQALTEI